MIALFFIIPVSSLFLCFTKDNNPRRNKIMNILLVLNAIFFLMPLAYAYWSSLPHGNLWDENGPGAILWYYFFVFPISLIVQIVLFIFKLKFKN